MRSPSRLIVICLMTSLACPIFGQAQSDSSLYSKAFSLPDKLFGSIEKKSDALQERMLRVTYKYLDRLQKQELKMQRKLAKTDSSAARQIFGDVKGKYDGMRSALNGKGKLQQVYSPRLDSMQTALSFLNKNGIVNNARLNETLNKYSGVQGKLNQTEFIHNQLRERQQQLKAKLEQTPLAKTFRKYREDIYYYRAQVDEYRKVFEDPEKVESLLLAAVNKIPAFQAFFAKYSQLGSLFQLPGSNPLGLSPLNGMQTRELLVQELGQRLGTGVNTQAAVGGGISQAQNALDALKDKLTGEQSNGDPEMRNFKPNSEKTKSFFQRLEVGTNMQSTKSNYFFPQTTDIAVTAGYKFKPNIVAGLGMSYRMGLGKDFRHIKVSHEGIGFRSYWDIKLKGSFWLTGGGEFNYRSKFKRFDELKQYSAWQQSALAGLSKKYAIGKKAKGNIQLLYDFLHKQQKPQTQAILFRAGYNLK